MIVSEITLINIKNIANDSDTDESNIKETLNEMLNKIQSEIPLEK